MKPPAEPRTQGAGRHSDASVTGATVLFAHGLWQKEPDSFGDLPQRLAQQRAPSGGAFEPVNFLFRDYVKITDELTIEDLARAFDRIVQQLSGKRLAPGARVSVIAHSTGGVVVRRWLEPRFGGRFEQCPVSHFIMLAPPIHGSALAQLGKSTLARIKSFLEAGEPGERVLNWLELGARIPGKAM